MRFIANRERQSLDNLIEFGLAKTRSCGSYSIVKLKLLYAALVAYVLAITVAAVTSPTKRLYWPLYLPIAVVTAIIVANRR